MQGVVAASPMNLHWIPVDFTARAVIALTRTDYDPAACVFHLCGDGPRLADVATVLQVPVTS